MRLFTNHLRAESALIQNGLELLNMYHIDLEEGKIVSLVELRMAIFAIQKLFEMSHIAKEESILYPALVKSAAWANTSELEKMAVHSFFSSNGFVHRSLLALRLAVDEWECDSRKRNDVQWMLGDFLDQSWTFFKNEMQILFIFSEGILTLIDQQNLYLLLKDFEKLHGSDAYVQARAIFNQLCEAKGMKSA